MLVRLLLALLALLAAPLAAGPVAELPNTRVALVSETARPKPGQPFTVGFVMTPRKGWHTYWESPGDSGMPTRADWSGTPGATATALSYPVPETYVVAGLMNHVFSAENVLLADVTLPADATGEVALVVRLDWLVCDDKICVPEGATLTLPLVVGDGAADPAQAERFAAARSALPRALDGQASFALADGRIRIGVPLAGTDAVRAAHFFALEDNALLFASPQQVSRTDDAIIIETAAAPGAAPARVPGLVRLDMADGSVLGFTLSAEPGPVPAGAPLAAAAPAGAVAAFWPALGLAVLGGLLLNLMPCVFPILSLKAMSLAKSGHSQAAARTEALAYTAGVVIVCTLLGLAAILLARAGWAFQLQDPRVILLLMLLMLAIGLNFAGLFEINLGASNAGSALAAQPGAKGAFFTGGLAAFVATPCTGPFMAGALGAALILPAAAGMAVFAGLGLGLALPFLAIGFVPALRRRLPRPGPWMLGFRRILAVPMLLTALALAWVLGQQAGVPGLTLGLAFALALALGLWWLGLRQGAMRSTALPLALAALAAIAAPLALSRLPVAAATPAAPASGMLLAAAPFSPQALAEARASRTPVFLYFTADWCITCKVNEKGALASPAVADAFERAGIQTMVGDWTRPDPAIARFLEQRQRAGIPLYLFFAADGSERELPQLLTVSMLTDLAIPGSSNSG